MMEFRFASDRVEASFRSVRLAGGAHLQSETCQLGPIAPLVHHHDDSIPCALRHNLRLPFLRERASSKVAISISSLIITSIAIVPKVVSMPPRFGAEN